MIELPEAAPDYARDVWTHFGGLHVPEGLPNTELKKWYKRAAGGRCMTCDQPVGEETQLIVSLVGIAEIYCSIECHRDQYVLNFLQKQFDGMNLVVQQKKRRWS